MPGFICGCPEAWKLKQNGDLECNKLWPQMRAGIILLGFILPCGKVKLLFSELATEIEGTASGAYFEYSINICAPASDN